MSSPDFGERENIKTPCLTTAYQSATKQWGSDSEGMNGPRGVNSPLLYRKRLVLWCAEPDHLALGVESIEINVGNDPQWTGRVGRCELRELAVREPGAAPSGLVQRRRGTGKRGSGHPLLWR